MKLNQFWSAVLATHVAILIVISLGFFNDLKIGTLTLNWGVVWFMMYLGYNLSPASWVQVNANEMGVKLFFGKVLNESESGLNYAPWPFITIAKFPSTTVSFDIPGVGEPIVRVTFQNQNPAVPTPAPASTPPPAPPIGDPIARAVTCEPKMTVTFKIDQPKNFIKITPTLQKAQEQLTDYAVSVLQMLAAKHTARDVLNNFKQFNDDLTTELEKLINAVAGSHGFDWGIKAQVVLKDIGLPHRVNIELAEMAASVAKPERAKNESEAERVKTVTAAEASKRATELAAEARVTASASDLLASENERQAAKKRGQGEGARMKAIRDGAGVTPQEALDAETKVKVAKNFDKVTTLVIGGSDNGLAGAGVIAGAINANAKPNTP